VTQQRLNRRVPWFMLVLGAVVIWSSAGSAVARDYGGMAPESYYWGGWNNHYASYQYYEILGPAYGPDGQVPSANADGVWFSTTTFDPVGSFDITWSLHTFGYPGDYGAGGEYFTLWLDMDRSGTWDASEAIYQRVVYEGIDWDAAGNKTTYFTDTVYLPAGLTPGPTWMHAKLVYGNPGDDGFDLGSPSLGATWWCYGEMEDYPAHLTPQLPPVALLGFGLFPWAIAYVRGGRRRKAEANDTLLR